MLELIVKQVYRVIRVITALRISQSDKHAHRELTCWITRPAPKPRMIVYPVKKTITAQTRPCLKVMSKTSNAQNQTISVNLALLLKHLPCQSVQLALIV